MKMCMIRPSDMFNMTDAFLSPAPDDGEGWVLMLANGSGMACINALFPKAHIKWRDGGEGVPDDWRGFSITCQIQLRRPSTGCRWRSLKACPLKTSLRDHSVSCSPTP